jgi:hypothetical protein
MSNEPNNVNDQPGVDQGFPPSDPNRAPETSTISSDAETAVSGPSLNDAKTTADNLADV